MGSVATLVALVHSLSSSRPSPRATSSSCCSAWRPGWIRSRRRGCRSRTRERCSALLDNRADGCRRQYFQPNLLIRAVILLAFVAVVLVLARSTVTDIALQLRDHFRRRKPTVPLVPAALVSTRPADASS